VLGFTARVSDAVRVRTRVGIMLKTCYDCTHQRRRAPGGVEARTPEIHPASVLLSALTYYDCT